MTRWRTVRVVVGTDIRRLGRDKVALFFYAVLPFVLIFAIGSFIPSDDVEVSLAVVDEDGGSRADELVLTLAEADGFELERYASRREVERDIRIGQANAAVLIPDGFTEEVEDGSASVEVLIDQAAPDATLVRSVLSDVIAEQSAVVTVSRELAAAGAPDPVSSAERAIADTTESEVVMRRVGTETEGSNYAFVAAGQMILFMFVNALTAGAGFIEMRRQGILSRASAGPVDPGDLLLGLGASRFALASLLAVVITVMAAVVYDVQWGSLWVLGGVIVMFGVVSAAASALIGAALSEPDASVSVGVPIGLGMAALGGCMFPLFLAPEGIQIASKVFTPHAWALDGILSSAYDGDTVVELWPNFAVLALWAVVLLALAWTIAGRSVRRGST